MRNLHISLFFLTFFMMNSELKSSETNLTRVDSLSLTSVNESGNANDALRFSELMNGIRGKLSPNIDKLTALGIEARNDAERRHYAEI